MGPFDDPEDSPGLAWTIIGTVWAGCAIAFMVHAAQESIIKLFR